MPNLDPDKDIYWPYINSTKGLIEAGKKSQTVKRMVFTQAGAGLVDSEDGDTLGRRMDRVLNGTSRPSCSPVQLNVLC